MATLNIQGQKVTVDDSFLQLSPEQQNATVDEIASSLNTQSAPQVAQPQQRQITQEAWGQLPANVQEGLTAQGTTVGGLGGQHTGLAQPELQELSAPQKLTEAGMATMSGLIEGVPVVGPAYQRGANWLGGQVIGLATGQDPNELIQRADEIRGDINQRNLPANISGQVASNIGAMGGAATTQVGKQALGMVGNLGQRVVNAGATGALEFGADAIARGQAPSEIYDDMAIGGGISAAIPLGGAVLKGIWGGASDALSPLMRGSTNPAKEASRRIATARTIDAANPNSMMVRQADENLAQDLGFDTLNIHRGGEETRALARQAANVAPDARNTLEKAAEDTFVGQVERGQALVNRVAGGDANAVLQRAQLQQEAQQVANPAYRALFSRPENASVLNEQLVDLMSSPTMRKIVQRTTAFGQDAVAGTGQKAPPNPFSFGADGSISLREGVTPSLEFWNYAKRLLDADINAARKSGDPSALIGIKNRLVSILDSEVPEYAAVRGERFKLFQAEDALTAGERMGASPRNIPIDEARAALAKMTPDERKSFEIGYLSKLMDRMGNTNDRRNLVSQFKVPAFREQMEAVLGKQRAAEFEGWIRIEDIFDKARNALGNSTTARQLAEMGALGGIGGVAGFGASGGDVVTGLSVGMLSMAGRRGAQMINAKVDEAVLKKVAEMLTEGSQDSINKAMANAVLSQQHMLALEAIQEGIGITTRGTAQALALN